MPSTEFMLGTGQAAEKLEIKEKAAASIMFNEIRENLKPVF